MKQPPPVSGKRKREASPEPTRSVAVQIVTGSYDRALHGFVATIHADAQPVEFHDNFLINAHASSIRSLAISPPSEPKGQTPGRRILATGGADEKVNLYQVATAPPKQAIAQGLDAFSQNRELGSLLHHTSTVTSLSFPSRGKLITASLDNKIAIARVRDWTVLTEIRAPIPTVQGRPSGDTATPGEVPAGINDVAVHPSAKLCISVGQGERSMRLWNLVTGKRAGVLTMEKSVLAALGEGRWRGGEGRSVVWSEDGEQFAVGFEKGAAVFDLGCTVQGISKVDGTKICRVRYLPVAGRQVLALSTEDGRIVLFDTSSRPAPATTSAAAMEAAGKDQPAEAEASVARFPQVGQLGEARRGHRIKDFVALASPQASPGAQAGVLIVAGSSDGTVDVWRVEGDQSDGDDAAAAASMAARLLGSCSTGKRITCVAGFVMDGADAANGAGKSKAGKAGNATTNGTNGHGGKPAATDAAGGDDWAGIDSDG